MSAIRIVDLTKKFGEVVAVNGLNLEIAEGELFGLLGVNGAGKSTTLSVLSCLTVPTSGDAFICEYSVTSAPSKVKELIGISMQETAVAKNLTVRENFDFFADVYQIEKCKKNEIIAELIEKFGLKSVVDKRAKTLSGGYQRKLSIALALISSPRVLFLDEPTLGLDVIARRELWRFIEAMKGKTTIILTTHYMEEAEALCDRIAIMANGQLKAVGTKEELLTLSDCEKFEDAFVKIATGGIKNA